MMTKNELERFSPLLEEESKINLMVYKKKNMNMLIAELPVCTWRSIPKRISSENACKLDYREYYYRFSENRDYQYYFTDKTDINVLNVYPRAEHFGVEFKYHISRINKYVYMEQYLNDCIQNYDPSWNADLFRRVLTMGTWYDNAQKERELNTTEKLSECIRYFLEYTSSAKEVFNLNTLDQVSGIYFMVLDGYKVCYIGKSINIKKRILQHWTRTKYFTGTGIDMYKAYDTTRIFVIPMGKELYDSKIDEYEINLIKGIQEIGDKSISLNVLKGGTEENKLLIDVLSRMNKKFY